MTVSPTRRLRLLVAYDGGGFHGFAAQPGQLTVAGALVGAIERYLRHTVELTCAGRTDSGVHAWGQVVTFDARADADPVRLARAVNRTLRPAIVVREAGVVDAGFDARRSATGRLYRYSILNLPVADPFSASTSWHVTRPLDLPAMRLACDALLGEHDFSSFCRRPPVAGASLVRVVRDARWHDLGEGRLRFDIEASAFCHQMVRSVVGTLVEVGLGKRRAGDMTAIVAARSRSTAGQPAPPHGLCLWQVFY
ncbi:MAG: tRNA pseudouridine(38-40) synthase TruA [Acidobacteriota bacterium]|nr:tRNA pseudouridine(38-40) synthase TruA [Acidobacteriota bacterium]